MIDTHAHIYLKDFKEDLDEIIEACLEVGIQKIYMPNIDSSTIDDMLEVASRYPDFCIPMMGLHPGSVDKDFQKELYIVEDWLNKRPFAAVGEIGIDLYWDKSFEEEQKLAFSYQIELAKKHELPIVIHNREAFSVAFGIVEKMKDKHLTGIFHCFTGTIEEAKKITDLNFLLGIGGVVTYKKGGLDQVLPHLSLENIVLETDSPYLTPVPFRGKRNKPDYLKYVVEKISELKNVSVEDISGVTTRTANKIFKKNETYSD